MSTFFTLKENKQRYTFVVHHDFEYCDATTKDGIFARIALSSLDPQENDAVGYLHMQLSTQQMDEGFAHLIMTREDTEIIGFWKNVNLIKRAKMVDGLLEVFFEIECLAKDVVWRTDAKRIHPVRKRKSRHV